MSQYQHQYYTSAPSGPLAPNPNSPFYAARQRFEHLSSQGVNMANGMNAPVPLHLRTNAYDYRQHSVPPKHPVQQARFGASGQPGASAGPSYGQSHNQQGYAGDANTRPQIQFGHVPTYQPPYAQTQLQPQGQGCASVQPTYRASTSALAATRPPVQAQYQTDFNAGRYANTPYAYASPTVPMPRMSMGGTSPAKAFAMYEAWNSRQQQKERAQEQQRAAQEAAAAQAQAQTQRMHQTMQAYSQQPQAQTQQYQPQPARIQYQPQQFQQQQQHLSLASPSRAPQNRFGPPASTQQVAPPLMSSTSAPAAPPSPQPQYPQLHTQVQTQPQALQRQPTVGSSRPLPQPGQARPRPVSMPPQTLTHDQGSTFQPSHFGRGYSSSVSNIPPRPPGSVGLAPVRPPSSFSSASPAPYSLPHPSSSSAPPASIPTARSIPGPRPEIYPEGSQTPEVSSVGNTTPQRTPAQRRALPQSPTAPPDLSQLQHRRSVPSLGSMSSFQPTRTSTLPPTLSSSGANEAVQPGPQPEAQPTPIPSVKSDPESGFDDDRPSVASSTQQDGKNASLPSSSPQSSPQYGILDLPKRNFSRAMDTNTSANAIPSRPKNEKTRKPDKVEPTSPQYGIKDLPMRTKSIVDRRKAWEKVEQGMQESETLIRSRSAKPSSTSPMSSSPTKSVSEFPTLAPVTSALSPSRRATAPAQTPIQPSRSPQPQTPQQKQKLPMPVVRQPQPSRTERTPSWTLPTADLDKIAPSLNLGSKNNTGEQKTSMALRFAQMAIEEENAGTNGSKNRAVASSPKKAREAQPPSANSSRTSTSASAGSSPTKLSYPSSTRTHASRRSANIDINLDDPPPVSLRRTPSPSVSTSTASSIPVIKTPEDMPQSRHSHGATPMIPKIALPGGFDDDATSSPVPVPVSEVKVQGQAPAINVVTSPKRPKLSSPQRASIPIVPAINLPGDDDADDSGPIISISVPSPKTQSNVVTMPVILDDLANPATSQRRSRGLPQPPSGSASSSSFTVSSASSSGSGSGLRSRGGGLVCGGCGQSIIGRIVSAMSLRWHPECFKCCQCGEHLEHVSSYEHDGKPYCHLDYHELFAPQCYSCKTPIIDERFITLDDPALGKRTYHEQHFFCAECGDPFLAPSSSSLKPRPSSNSRPNEINIKGDGAFDVALDEDGMEVGFTVFKGHPYCEACHVRLRAPKCKNCKKSIRDGMRAVEALGGKWCFECFVCAGCEKPFEEPSFFQRDKKPFCEHCFSIILRNEI